MVHYVVMLEQVWGCQSTFTVRMPHMFLYFFVLFVSFLLRWPYHAPHLIKGYAACDVPHVTLTISIIKEFEYV